MKIKAISLMIFALVTSCAESQNVELDNTIYPFNNAVRSLPNAPKDMVEQMVAVKELGFEAFAGHYKEDYFARRKAMDAVGLQMPEIYLPVTLHKDGSVTFMEEIRAIIKDSKDRGLLVALAAFSEDYEGTQEEGDKLLSKAIQELADYAAPYNVKIAVYPHVKFYCERLEHSLALAKMVDRPNVGSIFNTCHMFKVEGMEGWEQKLREAVPYLFMISINGLDGGNTQEMGWDQLIQPLGKGSFDTYEIVKLARENGYEGPFGLQCYNIKDDFKVALTQSMDTWRAYQKKYAETH